ncbi:hypothetical protein CC86DRAFT_377051 [Ophiobolus disseminans]|uniref:Uncharacterized protein n=1 Tax=Ophiobolus disseminans TaxID=1469910 RepID=A0A6A7ALG9_9PLEO|nr:hypothetical protein CC86DRAFT_377051 [Ophiobolus disseminans]
MAHQLCQQCQQLHFSLHDKELCTSLGCEVKSLKFDLAPLHSELVQLHATWEELDASSEAGCHLYTLRAAGLRFAASTSTRDIGPQSAAIWLAFGRRTMSFGEIEVSEYLFAKYGRVVAEFEVDIVPRTRCDDPEFFGESNDPFGNRNILFQAVYIGGREGNMLDSSDPDEVTNQKSTLRRLD